MKKLINLIPKNLMLNDNYEETYNWGSPLVLLKITEANYALMTTLTKDSAHVIVNGYPLMNKKQKLNALDKLLTTYANISAPIEQRMIAGKILLEITNSKLYQNKPCIYENATNWILEALQLAPPELAQIGFDFLSTQIKYSDKIFLYIYSSELISEYFIKLCNVIDLSEFFVQITKWEPQESEAAVIIGWCFNCFRNQCIGSPKSAFDVLSNLSSFQLTFELPLDISIYIIASVTTGDPHLKEHAFRYVNVSKFPLDKLRRQVITSIFENSSCEAFKLLVIHIEEFLEFNKEDVISAFKFVLSDFPYNYQRLALGLLFKYQLHTSISIIDLMKVFVKFLDDQELLEIIVPAILSVLAACENDSDLIEIHEILKSHHDAINELQQSSNEKLSEIGSMLSEFIEI